MSPRGVVPQGHRELQVGVGRALALVLLSHNMLVVGLAQGWVQLHTGPGWVAATVRDPR